MSLPKMCLFARLSLALFAYSSQFINILFIHFQTALHWAAKHGNVNVIKLIAGTYKADVNCRTVRVAACSIVPFSANENFISAAKQQVEVELQLN